MDRSHIHLTPLYFHSIINLANCEKIRNRMQKGDSKGTNLLFENGIIWVDYSISWGKVLLEKIRFIQI